MIFANGYDLKQRRGELTKLVRPAGANVGILAVGSVDGNAGFALRLDEGGTPVWSQAYQHQSLPLRFIDGAAAGKGGFLLLAATGPQSPQATEDLLVRIDAEGAVLWSRQLPNQGYGAVRLVRAVDPEGYVVLSWSARTPDRYEAALARLSRFDANGTLLGAVELADEGGGRLLDIAAIPRGYILVGDGGDGRPLAAWAAMTGEAGTIGRYGRFVELDTELGVRGSWLLRPPRGWDRLSIRLALGLLYDSFTIMGCLRGKAKPRVFAASLGRTAEIPSFSHAVAFDEREMDERPVAVDYYDGRLATLLYPDGTGIGATVAWLGAGLVPVGNHGIVDGGDSAIRDLRTAKYDRAYLVSTVPSASHSPFVAGLGLDFACCTMRDIDPRTITRLELKLTRAAVRAMPIGLKPSASKLAWSSVPVSPWPLCGERVDSDGERMVQSPHLDLQAAGSDGSDAARGVLLRWFLTGALDNHLAKGPHATTSSGFNKPDDYVALYRAEWPDSPPMRRLDLAVHRPVHVNHAKRIMAFKLGDDDIPDRFTLRFDSFSAYANARKGHDPLLDPAGFVAAYGDRLIEVELHGRLAIACDLAFTASAGGSIRIETLSAPDVKQLTPRQVSSRRVIGAGDGPVKRLIAENLRGLRLRGAGAVVESFAFICYEDVLNQLNDAKAWFPLGRFALTLDNATAFRQLEDPAHFQVDGHWRKYHGAARVRVQNYEDRWTKTPGGLREGVQTYLQLSDIDPTATATVAGPTPGDGAVSTSYLDMLQAVSFSDFHVARLLGQGFVDALDDDGRRYIHLAAYRSLGDLGDGGGARPVQHLCMSLPTTLADARLPMMPDLDGVHYGLSVPQGSGPPHQLTDALGYTAECDARYIRLYPGCTRLYAQDSGFWTPSDLFDLSVESLPVLYGIEYRAQGETGWREPRIANDPLYGDTQSPQRPEVRATPFPPERYDRAFVHKLSPPGGTGIFDYAAFSINMWSRASPVCAPVTSDMTQFWRRNTLLPPSDLLVQFIEPEAPLLLTTAWEQQALAALPSSTDRTFVRLCCNYGFTQDLAYAFADTIEILHRREIARTVKGALKAATPDTLPERLRIETKSCTYASTGETIAPDLPAALKPKFLGGNLVVGSTRFAIEDVAWPGVPGADPIFIVRKPTTSGVIVGGGGQNTLVTQDAPLDLHPGDLVMAVENLSAAANWGGGNPLVTTIAIGDSSWTTTTETFTGADGKTVSRELRGIWETAEVKATATAGRYEIVFASYVLAPHPQSTAADPVNWWRGVVRVPVDAVGAKEPRALNVVEIGTGAGGRLVLIADDGGGGGDPVLVAPGLPVNYYPGYKVYLHAHPDSTTPAAGFDWPRLTPAAGEGSRTTILGVRARDSTTLDAANQAYRSAVGPAQQLTANEIHEALAPQQPLGLDYATQPDRFNMSSYTMTVAFDHTPFSVVFYRAPALTILEALYDPVATLPGLLAAIFPPGSFFANRFSDLFAYSADARTQMNAIPLDAGGTHRMPPPDHPDLGLTGQLADDKALIREAILAAFTPLTGQPLVYAQISTDPSFVPTNGPQRVYDRNGEFLPASLRDLSPMAKRPPSGDVVQFTDFTLDGAMNPDTLYLYCAREISADMAMGPPSAFSRPVKLINFAAPAPPKVSRMTVAPYDVETQANPRISFELIEPAQVDPIARVRLFRATDPALALSLRTMDLIADVALATATRTADGLILIADDFASDTLIPYGDPLSYRLAWVREVHYADPAGNAKMADVPSEPSRAFSAELIDVVNPAAPIPVVTTAPADTVGERIVTITWSPTRYSATYFVTRIDVSGVWTRLGEVKTNDPTTSFTLPDALPVADEDGMPLFYRFAIDAVGPSGLVNLDRAPVTVRLDLV